MEDLRGTGVALVTPFKKDKSVDVDSLKKLVSFVIEGGVDYLVVMGTTAENPVLTKEEKILVLNTVINENKNRKPIVFGIGGYDTTKIIEEIKEFNQNTNITAFLSVTPYYNKPNQNGLYAHFAEIAKASVKPVILYNVPGRTGVNMHASTTLKLANDFKNIVAIKEASGLFDQVMEIIENKPKDFLVISGDDAITLPLISIGAEGVISVVANAIPSLFSTLVRKAMNNELREARELHYKALEFCRLVFTEGNPAGIKQALSLMGIIQNELRLPLIPTSEVLKQKIKNWIQHNI